MKVRLPKGPGAGGMAEMIKKMQDDMQAKQEELEAAEYTVSAGGGAVTVKINGKKEITSLDIAEEIVDPDDVETLSDVLMAAVNEAIRTVEETSAEEMGKITGQLGRPSVPGFPGF